jgi:hypothetical protein
VIRNDWSRWVATTSKRRCEREIRSRKTPVADFFLREKSHAVPKNLSRLEPTVRLYESVFHYMIPRLMVSWIAQSHSREG